MKKRETSRRSLEEIIEDSPAQAVSIEWCQQQSDETLASVVKFYGEKSEHAKGQPLRRIEYRFARATALLILLERRAKGVK